MAALVVTLAAALVTMAARFAPEQWDGAGDVIERSEALRAAAGPLAARDAAAYADVLAARRAVRTGVSGAADGLVEALDSASEVPREIAMVAAQVAELGRSVAAHGNPNLVGDAAAGVALAAAAARIAARLVALNLADDPGDPRTAETARLAGNAEAAARAVVR